MDAPKLNYALKCKFNLGEVIYMTKYREILRLCSLGLSQHSIADSCGVSKKTVNRVLKRAKELNIHWPLDENDTDAALAAKFFPSSRQEFFKRAMPYCGCFNCLRKFARPAFIPHLRGGGLLAGYIKTSHPLFRTNIMTNISKPLTVAPYSIITKPFCAALVPLITMTDSAFHIFKNGRICF